ncbi:uroporphyrinogen-III C-methyltransferase [Pseudoduganella sp. GCM10020061]|uniref:uroporphyrinogen-III C-methyltransferase n=1 Tax=Pseudoduganella sp. GCM10020061 TaxID=3317345 RepID=UPI00362DAC4D
MNDLPTLPDPDNAPVPSAAPQPGPSGQLNPGSTESRVRQLTVAVIVIGLLLAALAWSAHNRIYGLKVELARSKQESQSTTKDTFAMARQVADESRALQIKVGVLENRQAEAAGQQIALEQMYADLSKNRDEWALAEVEQVLSTASQQLQLAGNVPGALIALANADRSLSRSDKPQFITIRRAIARDIDRLKALPQLDVTGVAVRIDHVISQVDSLPMLSDAQPAAPARPERQATPVSPNASGARTALAKVQDLWHGWSAEMWDEMRELIRVRRIDTPEALMMSPEQSYFLRENVKLRLLNARVALLSRNETAFRDDIAAAQNALARHFDTRARATQSAQAVLRQVAANNLAIDMPTLADSLDAVRNYKTK